MKAVEEKVLLFIQHEKLIEQGDNIIVGFSGGADSVFLLSFLKKFQKKFQITLCAVHLNHKLRGKEADEDERFCKNFCERMEIPIEIKRQNVKAYAVKHHLSDEEAGRELRYHLFSRYAQKIGATKIATAHHRSDNTETVLLNVIKGSGLTGAAGIPVTRGNIIRPLLALTKDEIASYLQKKQIPFRVDSSNSVNSYQRNFLRNNIVPILRETLNPKLDEKIFNFSSAIRQFLEYVDSTVEEKISALLLDNNAGLLLPDKFILTEPEFLQREIVLRSMTKFQNAEVNNRTVIGVVNLFKKKPGTKLQLGNEIVAVRKNDAVKIEEASGGRSKEFLLRPGQTKRIFKQTVSLKEISGTRFKFTKTRHEEIFDGEKVTFPLVVRNWKQGDVFSPLGFSKKKRVSAFLSEQKLSSAEKDKTLVVVNKRSGGVEEEIVWVVKKRLDNRFAVRDTTKKFYKIRCT